MSLLSFFFSLSFLFFPVSPFFFRFSPSFFALPRRLWLDHGSRKVGGDHGRRRLGYIEISEVGALDRRSGLH